MCRIKTPISIVKLICAAVLILSSVIITPFEIKAATTEQRIAVLPIDTGKAGNFAYLGPAIEEALNSRLYKPGIISVVSPSDMAGAAKNQKAGSVTAMKDEAKGLGARYFITGEVSSDGKTPELTLQLMEVSNSKPIRSLSIKNALADDILIKIDGFIAETADAIVTGPQSVAETPLQDTSIHSNEAPTIKPMAQETPQKPEAVENNAVAMARINPDYFFYKKLDEIRQQGNTAVPPAQSKAEANKAERDAKEAKEAYENVLPYPAPSKASESSKEAGNTNGYKNAQVAASLEKATRKDGSKAPRITASSKIPYPTPEEIEAKAASAANAIPEIPPPASIIKTPGEPQAQVQAPRQGETKEGWLSWILKPFKAKEQNETQALNKPALPKEKDGAALPSKSTKPDTAGPAAASDGPIWQWY
jgi:TolB-like protein